MITRVVLLKSFWKRSKGTLRQLSGLQYERKVRDLGTICAFRGSSTWRATCKDSAFTSRVSSGGCRKTTRVRSDLHVSSLEGLFRTFKRKLTRSKDSGVNGSLSNKAQKSEQIPAFFAHL
ncbi:hypothetical protein R1flu_014582 [Riccia fluitans]|uniref:Uncharacterized protein n=1 Tax=Riccia fluitans TaxID=41844 RepID=A0ABD1YGI3_9MARC